MVLARGMFKRVPACLQREVEKSRLLIISSFEDSNKRITKENAIIRNKYIIEISDEMKVPYVSKNGLLNKLLKEQNTIA